MRFIPPLIVLLFAVTMLGVWALGMKRRHLLIMGLGFASFGTGLLTSVSLIFDRMNVTLTISTVFYLGGAFLFCEAVMERLGQRYFRSAGVLICAGVLCAIAYFMANGGGYAQTAPVVDLGLGLLYALLCVQARAMALRSWPERVLYVTVVLFSLLFFVQAVLALRIPPEIARPADLIGTPYWQGVMFAGSFLGVFIGLVILIISTVDLIHELQAERDADPLTGLLNRRGLERHAEVCLADARRGEHGIIIADLDRFKAINDQFGHAAGDGVLVEFARLLRQLCPPDTLIGRVGGEEFVLLVRGGAGDCVTFGRILCEQLSCHVFAMLPKDRRVTCSMGVAMVRRGEPLWEAAARADIALMRVKNRGRNRVAFEGPEFPPMVQDAYLLTA
ncbi:MAG: GGDEF domain-containing protein [Rhizobiales bacterium]|nr:GGDEF domain-containing protein [Hyphomicrobiales bacterium]OJY02898.1 MAG: GGDEF domain-containing protein [Rhizobiales bacterium 63-22]